MTGDNLFEKYGLSLGDKSGFFKFAKKIEKLNNLVSYIKAEKTQFKHGVVLASTLHLPDWPNDIDKPKIFSFSTPENNAITIGRFKIGKNELEFQLPRFHVGVLAQMDLQRAMRQVTEFDLIKDMFKRFNNLSKEVFGIEFTREGHLANFQESIFRQLNKTVPFTLVHVKHFTEGIKNRYERITMVSRISLEGLEPKKTRLAVLVDSVASGMQQVAVGEYLLNEIRIKTKKSKLKQIIVVAPMLNLWGAMVVSLWAASEKISIKFITCGGLLLGPDDLRYYSAVMEDKRVAGNLKLARLHQAAHDDKSRGRACTRSNWTASFLAPTEAMDFSDNELKTYGSSNQKLLETSKKITLEKVKQMGIDPELLIPYSTRYEAKKLGKENELIDLLE